MERNKEKILKFYETHGIRETAKKWNTTYYKMNIFLKSTGVKIRKGNESGNICMTCKRSARFIEHPCPWAHKFEPVEGWTATKVTRKDGTSIVETYNITECPLYIEDNN